jgi:hypothetical protein
VPNALRRILSVAGAVALLFAAGAAAPAHGASRTAPVVVAIAPADGATVPAGNVELTWASSEPAASFEVRWGTTGDVGPDGLLVADGEAAGLTEPRFGIPDLADLEYHWQARAIGTDGSAGPWSDVSSFTVLAGTGEGEQLDTLTPGGAEAPDVKPARAPGGWGSVDGILYLLVASAFAVLLLAFVARAWVRERRAA